MLGPILYWDLVRYVRSPTQFTHRVILAGVAGVFVFASTVHSDPRLVGSITYSSEVVAALSFFLQTLAIYLFVPAMLAGSICDDRRLGRLDLLMTTALSRRRIVLEKFLVGVGLALLAMLTLLPFTLLGPMFGGVEPNAVVKAELAAVVETMFVAAATLMISARSKNGSEALVKSYVLLFTLRFALPHLESIVVAATQWMLSPLVWRTILSISPAAASHDAWLDASSPEKWGPPFGIELLIIFGLTATALVVCVRNLARSPATTAKSRRRSSPKNESLLDAEPLVWRAIHVVQHDGIGLWRTACWLVAVFFAVLVWSADSSLDLSFWATFIILATVFVANAVAPAQWLISERKSGWFRELQMTPLSMEDVLWASVKGTRCRMRPIWIMAAAALTINTLLLARRDLLLGLRSAYVAFFFSWLVFQTFWSAIREGFSAETLATALRRIVVGHVAHFMIGLLLLSFGLSSATIAAYLIKDFGGFGSAVAMLLGLVVICAALLGAVLMPLAYIAMVLSQRRRDLQQARTTLHVLDRTANFGRKSGAKAWEDWVGVSRNKETPTLRDVYRETAKLQRSYRR